MGQHRTFTDPQTKRQAVIKGTFADESGLHSTLYTDDEGWRWLIDASGKELTGGGQYKASISPVQVDKTTNETISTNPYGAKVGRTVAAADDFVGIAEAIDDAVLRWKMEQAKKQSSGSALWWLLIIAAIAMSEKKR